jgi:O-antigen/teichoic acid export membrane protein
LRETTGVAHGALAIFSSGFLFSLLSLGSFLVIVRILSANALGEFYSLQIVSTLAITFALLSIPSGCLRFLTGYVQTGRIEEARYLFRKSLLMGVAIVAVSVPTLILLSPLISMWLFGSEDYVRILYLVVGDFGILAFNSFLSNSLYAHRHFGRLGILQIIYGLVRFGVGIGLILLGFGVVSLIYGWIVSDVFSLGVYAYLSRPLLFGPGAKTDLRQIFSYSFPLLISSGVVLILQNVDRLFVLKYLGVDELGIYGTLLNAAGVPQLLPQSLAGSLSPVVIKFEEQKGLSPQVVSKSVRYLTGVTMPILGLIAALGSPLISLLLRSDFSFAWVSFAVLTLGNAAMSLALPFNQVLLAKKLTRIIGLQQIVSSASLAVLAVLLIPEFFLTGAALAYVLASVAGLAFILPVLLRVGLFKVDWREYVKIVACTATIVATVIAAQTATNYSAQLFPVYLAIGVVAGVASVRALGVVNEEDYQVMMEVLPNQVRPTAERLWRAIGLPAPTPPRGPRGD